MIPVISVVGYANSGKTTLLEKIVREIKKQGLKVAVIKHHHKDVDIDVPGKDTWRMTQAGADTVVIASPGKTGIIEKTNQELSLPEIISRIKDVDLIITEGYKKEKMPKIEVFRSEVHTSLITPREELLAVASDVEMTGIPTFGLDDAKGMVNFLVEKLKLSKNAHSREILN